MNNKLHIITLNLIVGKCKEPTFFFLQADASP